MKSKKNNILICKIVLIFALILASIFVLFDIIIKYEAKKYNPLRDQFPKVWAHGVNDLDEVAKKQYEFKGLEVDLFYSETDNRLYVGHNEEDTINKILFSTWLSKLVKKHRKNTYYWLDIKNLSYSNSDSLANRLHYLEKKFEIEGLFWVESYMVDALEQIKNHGFQILLWVDNLYWNKELDAESWYKITKERVERLHPDGLSCEFRMYPLLTDSFPDENIFFWHTPADFTPENVAFTQQLCREKSVKAVLVDYDKLIEY